MSQSQNPGDPQVPPSSADEAPPEPASLTAFHLGYAAASQLAVGEAGAELRLCANNRRPPVRFAGRLKDPLRARAALSALHAVVAGDFRYKPKDRTAYLAYLQMRRESAGLGAWQAQQAYFSWLQRNDPTAFLILDPLLTVHPDRLLWEVFSKDEGAYACLTLDRDQFELEGPPEHGVTNIDFSDLLLEGVRQLRGYRQTTLRVGPEAVRLQTEQAGPVLEKTIHVPDSWLRGFLQVQSAATLPGDTIALAPIDLYNALRHLRMHADQKGKRRGVRVELVPGQPPNLVLEPWEKVIRTSAEPYRGKTAKAPRVWGRRRLMMLRALLPYTERVEVRLLGSGLPNFWILRGQGFTFTLGITGFTSSNWSQAVGFDLLLPRKTQAGEGLAAVLRELGEAWLATSAELGKATGLSGAALVEALQTGCQQGLLMYDLAHDVYRLRPVAAEPLDLGRLAFRTPLEKLAHDLAQRKGAVKITAENRVYGVGVELEGKVVVAEDKREYLVKMLLTDDGNVGKAESTSPQFRKHGLKHGPDAPLIALRLAHARLEIERRAGKARQGIVTETRSYSKRDDRGEETYQVTLDRRRLKTRWGPRDAAQRLQTLRFASEDEARQAYFERIEELLRKGYLDSSG